MVVCQDHSRQEIERLFDNHSGCSFIPEFEKQAFKGRTYGFHSRAIFPVILSSASIHTTEFEPHHD